MSRTDSRADAPIALTPGEPAGIGPDIALSLASRPRGTPWVALADPGMLATRAHRLGLEATIHEWSPGTPVPMEAGVIPVLPIPLKSNPEPGVPEPENARSLLDALDRAVDGCHSGEFRALVTGPLAKSVVANAGIPFTGHTEYLAARTGGTPVMMLVAGSLRVALVTTHLALRDVADAITVERVESVIRVVDTDLRARFGIPAPRIAVLGLNPHAGESGHLGREEIEIISPVIARLQDQGFTPTGPLSADTAYTPAALARCDAVVAMYHDQGLPVLKHAGFGGAVNCTLGLPIVRTSVDHGTALDIAGTGRAEDGSLVAALELAARMSDGA